MIHTMHIKFAMGTWLAKFKVQNGGLRWIWVILILMKPTTSPTFSLSYLFGEYDKDTPPCSNSIPLIFCGMTM